MILYENPEEPFPVNRQLAESEGEDEEDSSGDYQTSPSDEDEDELDSRNRVLFLLNSFGLNLNNLNLNLPNLPNLPHLPNINIRNTSLWKFYEHGVENLYKLQNGFMVNLNKPDDLHLDISESLDLGSELNQDIFISTKKEIKDPTERFHFGFPKLRSNSDVLRDQDAVLGSDAEGLPEPKEEKTEEDESVAFSEEFWLSIVPATTECPSESAVHIPVPGTQTTVRAPINPFFHRTGFSLGQKIKVGLGTVLAIIRVPFILIILTTAWLLSTLSTAYVSAEDLRTRPLSGWRRATKHFIANVIMRILFFVAGFYWVRKRGRQATRKEAPILVVAPHSSFFDAFPLILMGSPSIVAKSEVSRVPFFGQLVNMTQAVYVTRESRESRTQSLNLIKERAQSGDDWDQIYIYPEGTCTNRSALVSFKLGAFYAGVPVQPVIIKYPNNYDSVTWTFDGLPWYHVVYRTLSQFTVHCEIEFLPVHTPTPEEIEDPKLFANNVRQEMADALGVPVTDYRYEDGTALSHMDTNKLSRKLRLISKLRTTLKLSSTIELNAVRLLSIKTSPWWLGFDEFVDLLDLESAKMEEVTLLYETLKDCDYQKDSGQIDIREYFVYSCLLNHNIRVEKIIPIIFLMYAEGQRRMTLERFVRLMECIFKMSEEDATEFFKGGHGDGSTSEKPIDFDTFTKMLKKRLEYLRLYALEASGLLHAYPPREREINACKNHSDSIKNKDE